MNSKLHIADADLTLYAMGALSPEEMRQAEAHLEECARCTEELRQNTLALAAYAQTTAEVELPAGAKDRFMARLAATPQTGQAVAPARESRPARESEPASLWQRIFGSGAVRWSPALAGALALALLAVGVDDLRNRAEIGPLLRAANQGALDAAQLNQLMELLTSPQAKRVALRPGPVTAPPPEGRVVYAARTGKLLLTASNLKPLPEGKIYELWILQPGGKKPLPAGTFAPDNTGNATMILADAPAGLDVQGFGVTIEKAGGAETPTLPIVLSGL
jgi:anti-sigma-K factor RskA